MLLIKNGYMIDPKSGREGKLDILTAGDRILRSEKVWRGRRNRRNPAK